MGAPVEGWLFATTDDVGRYQGRSFLSFLETPQAPLSSTLKVLHFYIQGSTNMKYLLQLGIAAFLFATFSSSGYALAPEQICQARKNMEVARFLGCRHRVLSGLPDSRFRLSTQNCRRTFNRRWRRVTARVERLGGSCKEAPIEGTEVRGAIRGHISSIRTLLGRGQRGVAAKRRCRALKTVATGRYAACIHRAEVNLVRTSDTEEYATRTARCETNLEAAWSRITSRTEEQGTTCFDHPQTHLDFKTLIDVHTEKVVGVLAGVDQFAPISIEAVGSPLTLIADGDSGSLTITNNSDRATAYDIEADFSGTALEGNVEETGNTCSQVAPGASCTLTFTPGNTLVSATDFTIQGSNTDSLSASIAVVSPSTAIITVTASPLTLTVNGATGDLTITNTSTATSALNISSDFTGTALEGNITETGNTCANVGPGDSCALTFTSGNTIVPQTNFTIEGSNTNALTAAISIQSGSGLTAINPSSGSASGGVGVTLTGTGLTGATSVTFNGVAATSVNVVNSTTVTAVTPALAAGAVDVVIDTPAGGATLLNAFTYEATAEGQASGGGTIACLDGGLNYLIAAIADNNTSIEWGGLGIAIGPGAQDNSDGDSNTEAIVFALNNQGIFNSAAQLCNDFEVDSQGNTPCEAGNTCYDDWFLPAVNQLDCLFENRVAIGGFANDSYWSSTESSDFPDNAARDQTFSDGLQDNRFKNVPGRLRCVRAFVP